MTNHLSADEYLASQGLAPVGKPKMPAMKEREFQKQVIMALRLKGYRTPREHFNAQTRPEIGIGLVWQTADSKGNTNDAGLPDLIISPRGRRGIIGIELKRPDGKGRKSVTQAYAEACGAYVIVNDLDEVLRIVAEEEA
jgi:hypothetical protein